MKSAISVLLISVLLVCSCEDTARTDANRTEDKKKGGQTMEIRLTSSAFENEGMIPTKYTCDGEDISPQLTWENIPDNAESIALIADDPDAPTGTFVHWVLYDMPANVSSLPENVPADKTLDYGAKQGDTSFGKIGYGGPCPPSGTHRYYFKIYALDSMLDLDPGADKQQLLDAMEGHILAQGQLMGRYSR